MDQTNEHQSGPAMDVEQMGALRAARGNISRLRKLLGLTPTAGATETGTTNAKTLELRAIRPHPRVAGKRPARDPWWVPRSTPQRRRVIRDGKRIRQAQRARSSS